MPSVFAGYEKLGDWEWMYDQPLWAHACSFSMTTKNNLTLSLAAWTVDTRLARVMQLPVRGEN